MTLFVAIIVGDLRDILLWALVITSLLLLALDGLSSIRPFYRITVLILFPHSIPFFPLSLLVLLGFVDGLGPLLGLSSLALDLWGHAVSLSLFGLFLLVFLH